MDFQLVGDNFDVTDTTRQLVADKVALPLDKLLVDMDPDLKQAVIKIKERHSWGYKVNFDMTLPGKKKIYAETTKDTLMFALTDLRKEVERQIQTYKGKLNPHGNAN